MTVREVSAVIRGFYQGVEVPDGPDRTEVYIASSLTKPGIMIVIEQLPEFWLTDMDAALEWLQRRRG